MCKCSIQGDLYVGSLNGSQNQNISQDDSDAAAAATTMIVSAWFPVTLTLSENEDGPPGITGVNNGDGTITYNYYHIVNASNNFDPNQNPSTEAPGSYTCTVEIDCAPFYSAKIVAGAGWTEEANGGHVGIYGQMSGPFPDCDTDITDSQTNWSWTIVRTGHQVWEDPNDNNHWAVVAVDDTITPTDLSSTNGSSNGIDGFMTKDSNGDLGAFGGNQLTLWGNEDPSQSPEADAFAYLNSDEPAFYINDTAGHAPSNTQSLFTTDNIYITDENDDENIDLSIDPKNGKAEINANAGGQSGSCYFGMLLDDGKGTSELLMEAGGGEQYFKVFCDDSTSISTLEISQKNKDEYFSASIDSDLGISRMSGTAGGIDGQHYSFLADDSAGTCSLSVYNDTNNQEVQLKVNSDDGTAEVYGVAGNNPYFQLKADHHDSDAFLYLNDGNQANTTLSTSELIISDGQYSSATLNINALELTDGSSKGTYEPGAITLSDGSNNVYINIPGGDATWRDLQVCVSGTNKTIKVLCTEPE
jgi:hypothetical protein